MSEQEKIKMPLIQKKLQNYIINSSFNKLGYKKSYAVNC